MSEVKKTSGSDMAGTADAFSGEGNASAESKTANVPSVNVTASADMEVSTDDVKWSEEFGYSEKIGTDENYLEAFTKTANSMSLKDGVNSSITSGVTRKAGALERTDSQTIGMKFDGSDIALNQDSHTSMKMGNENASVEVTNDFSNSISTDGTIKNSASVGSQLKTEHAEAGAKVSASNSSSENSEEQSVKMEASSGVKFAEGMEMKNSVSMRHTDKFSETEEGFKEEETQEAAFQSRIEVDSQKAGLGKQMFAGMYNVTMETAETAMSGALSSSSAAVYRKEEAKKGEEETAAEENAGEENIEEEKEAEQSCDYYYGMGY